MGKPRVVVVGAGFAGLQCARRLDGRPVDVLLVDRCNYHLFTPLLYQVATCLLTPSDIAIPLRKVFRGSPNVRFRQAGVVGVDLDAKRIRTDEDGHIGYDRLVLAAGSESNYFANGGIERNSIGLKSLPEALALRNHTLRCLEEATASTSDVADWLTFVVAGGGPTGVEYAGALAELARLVLPLEYPEVPANLFRIVLVEGRERLLPQLSEASSRHALRALERRGVEVHTSTFVSDADAKRVRLSDGTEIAARTLVWSAGVRPTDLVAFVHGRPDGGRIQVDSRLGIEGRTDAVAIGDAAAVRWDEGELPMLAPPAMQEGRYVAARILALDAGSDTEPFVYKDKGTMATIGRSAAVVELGPLHISGFAGWVLWLLIHLYYLIGFKNRLQVLTSWAWNYVRYDRPIRIDIAADRTADGLVPSPRAQSSSS
ncbi:MAG: NAD(P)/FAD-dependent oxidoreductase [Acidimicrobiia bacterium]|nr:NAD(P)/FAD-dependent oxidoreductase [Acidimicrobiia bacterium]